MFVLDTDHLSLLEWRERTDTQRLRRRLAELPAGQVASTVITYEEQTRGWLAVLAGARSEASLVEAYRRLTHHLDAWREILVLPFDARSAVEYRRLLHLRLRVGTMDLRIAAIALAHDAAVLTRNLRDFQQVSGLRSGDWTR